MSSQELPRRSQPGRKGHVLSMHSLTPEDALHAVLSISPGDLATVNAEEAKLTTPKGKLEGK